MGLSGGWILAVGFVVATVAFWGGVFAVEALRAKWRRDLIARAEKLRNAAPTPALRKAYEDYLRNYNGEVRSD